MARAAVLMIDSLGIGGAPDADKFGDEGANTLGNIAVACAQGLADKEELRSGTLHLPNLTRWGLARAAEISTGHVPAGLNGEVEPEGLHGCASERSKGKDTPSGHWEMAGVPVTVDWGYFPREEPCFPDSLVDSLIERARLPGVLGNRHASGTAIIEELGDEHLRTGKPIVYTSADSVFQIAAHERSFGLQRLFGVCETARELVDAYNVGRVIARPFCGTSAATFERTGNRRDYATSPPSETLLDRLTGDGGTVISVGKIADIFADRGISKRVKAIGNEALFDATLAELVNAPDRSIVFANFVEFDSAFGHRRDVAGYAAALEAFDRKLPVLESLLKQRDLAIITADHGCDPTWRGADHTRENVPILVRSSGLARRSVGFRDSFADIGQSLAEFLDLSPLDHGYSFLGLEGNT